MVESFTVFVVAAALGASSTVVSEVLRTYLHYLGCFVWQGVVGLLKLYHLDYYQSKMSAHLGALLDEVGLDSNCRTFKHKDASWKDGRPETYIFLGTPSWSAYFLQLVMLGHWIWLPRDVEGEHVCMLV